MQDNWKVNRKLTLDYGLRLVHQQPQYDQLGQASNFSRGVGSARRPSFTGPAARRAALHRREPAGPRSGDGALLGPNTAAAIGTLVPGSGNATNGLLLSGKGIAKTTYTWPKFKLAPRFGVAYDITGNQTSCCAAAAGSSSIGRAATRFSRRSQQSADLAT